MVAKAKAQACRRMYDDLDTEEGQNNIFRIAKARDSASKDISQRRLIKMRTTQ